MIPPVRLQMYFVIKIGIPDGMPVIDAYNADPVCPDVRNHIHRSIPRDDPEDIAIAEVLLLETYIELHRHTVAERESSILIQTKGSPVFRIERVGFEGKPAGYFIIFCICAVAYLIGWCIMKILVPKYKPIVID